MSNKFLIDYDKNADKEHEALGISEERLDELSAVMMKEMYELRGYFNKWAVINGAIEKCNPQTRGEFLFIYATMTRVIDLTMGNLNRLIEPEVKKMTETVMEQLAGIKLSAEDKTDDEKLVVKVKKEPVH